MSWVTLDRFVSKEARSDEAVRRQLEQDARPLRSRTASMGEEDLLAKLSGLGVDADQEKLAKLCEGALSAEEVVSERLRLQDWDADWAWNCLVTLWETWWPDKVCLELLDDKVQAGYEADQRNDVVASSRIWLDAWSDVLWLCDAVGARSIEEFDDRFPMTQSVFNWCQDLEMALQNGGEHDPELRTARLEMAAEWLRRFPHEDSLVTANFRRALRRPGARLILLRLGQCGSDIGMAEVVSLKEQGLSGGSRQGVREAVPKVQPRLVTAAFPEVSVCVPRNASLLEGHCLYPQFRGVDQLVETTAGDRIPARVDDHCGLQEVSRGDPPDLSLLDSGCHVTGIVLSAEDRDQGRGIDDHAGSPRSS